MLNPAAWRLQVARDGDNVQWLRATPCDCYDPAQNFTEQRGCTVCEHGQVYRDGGVVRGQVGQQKANVVHPELGLIREGELTLTTLPSDVRFGPFDKVVLLDRDTLTRERLHRGDDIIPHTNLVAVLQVSDSTTIYREFTDYTVDLETGEVTWVTAGPTNVYAVEYTYHPTYWYLGMDLRPPRPTRNWEGAQDTSTPQKGVLSLTPPPG